jgi:hypothetical protein
MNKKKENKRRESFKSLSNVNSYQTHTSLVFYSNLITFLSYKYKLNYIIYSKVNNGRHRCFLLSMSYWSLLQAENISN